jgi:hypothetical protein
LFPTEYLELSLKIPQESEGYNKITAFVTKSIESMIQNAIQNRENQITIDTNLKLGLPMENINKIAGPFVEAWACQIFSGVLEDSDNTYQLINVEAGERLNMADVILQFKRIQKSQSSITANIDVKATSQDIPNSGKSPNITSFARIRTAYLEDPDFIFTILSLKHKVYSERDPFNQTIKGIMEVVACNAYDLKYLSDTDLSYNPALGSGQLQVRDIHYVQTTERTVWEFCQLLDRKCIASKKGFTGWLEYAKKNDWIH